MNNHSDKSSCEDINNPFEAIEDCQKDLDKDYIVVTNSNKDDIMEFSIIFLESIAKEISNRQNLLITTGKIFSSHPDELLKSKAKAYFVESSKLARRYKEIKFTIFRLEGDMSLEEVIYIFRNIEKY